MYHKNVQIDKLNNKKIFKTNVYYIFGFEKNMFQFLIYFYRVLVHDDDGRLSSLVKFS